MEKSWPDMGNPVSSAAMPEDPKEIISEARILLEKLDYAFEGMIDDADPFLDGWFAVRKIKGRHKSKDKVTDENN